MEKHNLTGVGDKPLNENYTPDFITSLGPKDIFVFGSNIAGAHAGGAARIAAEKFGAVWGHGTGLQGNSYAIPTMQGGVETIKPYVDEFIAFAKSHPELTFYVTRIGCGIAGFRDEEIAPLFKSTTKGVSDGFAGMHLHETSPEFGDIKTNKVVLVSEKGHKKATSIKYLSSFVWEDEILASMACRYEYVKQEEKGGIIYIFVKPK